MMLTATLYAHDVMDLVIVTASVRALAGATGEPTGLLLQASTEFRGVGESRPDRWLEDALVGLLERL